MIPGGYEVKVNVHGMPQKVASGFDKVFEGFVGAKYDFIAYLGSKVVNGINHALLCKQTLTTRKDVTSIVLLILNEKPGDVGGETLTIVEIQTLLSDTGLMGGYHIDPITQIPNEIMEVFTKNFGGFFGASNKPFALVATQVVNGIAYVFAVESTMVVSPSSFINSNNSKSISLIKVYDKYDKIENVAEVIKGSINEQDKEKLGYAFNWLTGTSSNDNSVNWP